MMILMRRLIMFAQADLGPQYPLKESQSILAYVDEQWMLMSGNAQTHTLMWAQLFKINDVVS